MLESVSGPYPTGHQVPWVEDTHSTVPRCHCATGSSSKFPISGQLGRSFRRRHQPGDALRRTTEVVTYTEGGSANQMRKFPGRTEYEAITLERGVTQDPEFEAWASQVCSFGVQQAGSANFRKDIVIEVYDEAGQLARSYKVHRCWVSEYQALPELDGSGNGLAIEQIRLEHEGWERVQESSRRVPVQHLADSWKRLTAGPIIPPEFLALSETSR